MSIVISAAICSFNRGEILAKALRSLCEQKLPPELFEIILVDNASTDNTSNIVNEIKMNFPSHRIRYHYEAEIGTGFARNRVILEAEGDWIAYLDDDALADEDWLFDIFDCIQANPDVWCFGGKIIPYYQTVKPLWFLDKYETRSWGEKQRFLKTYESFSGSNMIWNKNVLERFGGFPTAIGPKGLNFSFGEDTMPFLNAWNCEKFALFYYSPKIKVYHLVPAYKFSIMYQLKRSFISGQTSWLYFYNQKNKSRIYNFTHNFLSGCFRFLIAIFKFHHYERWQNWMIEEGKVVMDRWGGAFAALGIEGTIKRG